MHIPHCRLLNSVCSCWGYHRGMYEEVREPAYRAVGCGVESVPAIVFSHVAPRHNALGARWIGSPVQTAGMAEHCAILRHKESFGSAVCSGDATTSGSLSNPYFGIGRYVRPIDPFGFFWLNCAVVFQE